VLLDRAFFTVEVIEMLKRSAVYFIIPAVNNGKVKEAMQNYYAKQPAKRFILGNKRRTVAFNLYLCKRSALQSPKKKKLAVSDLYFGFATNLPSSDATELPSFIPYKYRSRWGIEAGYRVQDNAQAKTASINYKLNSSTRLLLFL
jgi:hypothetical protein